jgi:hypothetical protein
VAAIAQLSRGPVFLDVAGTELTAESASALRIRSSAV